MQLSKFDAFVEFPPHGLVFNRDKSKDVPALKYSNYLNQDNIGVEILHTGVQNVINHLNILELEKRYNYYQNIIKSTIYKRVRYNKNYITQISNIINKPPEFIEASLIKQDLFSENEPFIKLKSDIWEQIQ